MLTISGLTKTYGTKTAVDNLSLHIAPGEICGFIGHNGAGKTTTLKACCGILSFDAGEIKIGGISVQENPVAVKQMLAYIPDNPDLYTFLTGHQYLNFVADIYGVSAADRQERIRYYGELLGMTDDLALPISDCSHGMKQKVALISALIIAVVTFFICWAGVLIGRKFGTKLASKASVFGGIILIFIGLEIFITSWF